MPSKPDPPVALVAFAEELRAHRAQAGMSRDELAARVSYSPSLIAMIETGRRSPSPKLAVLLDPVVPAVHRVRGGGYGAALV